MKRVGCNDDGDGNGGGVGGDCKTEGGNNETSSLICTKKQKVSSSSDDSLSKRSQSLSSLDSTLFSEETKDLSDGVSPPQESTSVAAASDPTEILTSSHPLSHFPKMQITKNPISKTIQHEYLPSAKHSGDSSSSCLSEPLTPIIDGTDPIEQLRDLCGAIVGSAEACGRRSQMEDAHVIVPNLATYMDDRYQDVEPSGTNYSAFCVLDGHAGDRVSQYVVKNLPLRLKAEIEKINSKNESQDKERSEDEIEKDIINALYNAHKNVDNEVMEAAKSAIVKWKDGSTAITVIMENADKLYIANIGDCRAVLATLSDSNTKMSSQQQQSSSSSSSSSQTKDTNEEENHSVIIKNEQKKLNAIALSNDHHPSVKEEADRIKKCGGFVSAGRLMGMIEVSRAFGDLRFRNSGLICEPEITTHKINKGNDKFFIVASDGIWKVVSNELAVNLVSDWLEKETDVQSVALKLIQKAHEMGSTDNATVIIVVFPSSE